MDAHYSRRHLDMALKTDNRRSMDHPDGYGKNTGDCGDTIEIYLIVLGTRIRQVSYLTNGCLDTNACANAVVQMTTGLSVTDAWRITPDHIIAYLGTLDHHHHHCAELAVGALYRALSDAHTNTTMPWRKLYRAAQ
jgi:nitrogen fixation NifU-like protein